MLQGGKGADRLFGKEGHDRLRGGGSEDSLTGGLVDARRHGGKGADIFVFGSGFGSDVIRDFAIREDLIVIDAGIDAEQVQWLDTAAPVRPLTICRP